jgi:hypothetical protein
VKDHRQRKHGRAYVFIGRCRIDRFVHNADLVTDRWGMAMRCFRPTPIREAGGWRVLIAGCQRDQASLLTGAGREGNERHVGLVGRLVVPAIDDRCRGDMIGQT